MVDKAATSFFTDDVELIEREVLHKGVFTLTRLHLRHRQFNGGWSNTFTREILERKPAAAVLPYDPITQQVVLIEQFRAGALSNAAGPWLLEVVAGTFNENEQSIEVAKREAEEEAGCKILDIYRIYEYFVSPGGSNEELSLFVARINSKAVDGVHGLAEEDEDIRAFTISLEKAFALMEEGKIKTTPAIIALQWLQLNRERLKQIWQIK